MYLSMWLCAPKNLQTIGRGRGVDEEESGRVRALGAESLDFGRCGSAVAGAGARLVGLESVWGRRRGSR